MKNRRKKRRNQKNTNLIGCPSDQVKDWALATRSGREGERRGGKMKGKERYSRKKEKERGGKEKLPLSVKCAGVA